MEYIKIKNLSESLIDSEVIYSKRSSSRHGWRGYILEVDMKAGRFTVSYDNGVIQDYAASAVVTKVSSYNNIDLSYIKVVDMAKECDWHKPVESKSVSLRLGSYLVVNMVTSKVVAVEPDKASAELSAQEWAQDSTKFERFGVFGREASFTLKRPVVTED